MKRNTVILLFAFFAAAVSVVPSYSTADDDPCSQSGIVVRNATMLDLWYEKNGGPCSIWTHEHRLTIKPKDTIKIYSNMDCKTLYCPENPSYKDYKSLDANGSCGVRILSSCNLSDM